MRCSSFILGVLRGYAYFSIFPTEERGGKPLSWRIAGLQLIIQPEPAKRTPFLGLFRLSGVLSPDFPLTKLKETQKNPPKFPKKHSRKPPKEQPNKPRKTAKQIWLQPQKFPESVLRKRRVEIKPPENTENHRPENPPTEHPPSHHPTAHTHTPETHS